MMVLGAAALLLTITPLRADDPIAIRKWDAIPPTAPTNKWDAAAAAGMTLTRGNSETLLMTLGIKALRRGTNHEVLLGAAGTYGENTTEKTVVTSNGDRVKKDETTKTAASASGYGQFNYLLTDRFYTGGRVDLVHDEIADLKYRATVSPLAGYYAIKNPWTKLSFEAGPSGVFEQQGDEANQYAALRVGDRFEHKFAPKARAWQTLDIMPQVDRFSNYLILAEVGAEAALTDRISLRAILQDTYDNEPALGRKNNDIKLITALAYKF